MMITTKEELIQYAMRRLGHPVIEVNIAEEQAYDCLDESLQRYYEFHSDGSQRIYLLRIATADDASSQTIAMPDDVLAVTHSINLGDGMGLTNLGNLTNQMYIADIIHRTTFSSGGMGYARFYTEYSNGLSASSQGLGMFQANMNYLQTLNQLMVAQHPLRFIKHGHKVRFDASNMIKQGDIIVFECYAMNTAEAYKETYNDFWLKRYFTAMMRKQWANNLMKYNGFQLPSGMTIDGSTMLQEANNDLDKLEQELREVWEEPIMPLIG